MSLRWDKNNEWTIGTVCSQYSKVPHSFMKFTACSLTSTSSVRFLRISETWDNNYIKWTVLRILWSFGLLRIAWMMGKENFPSVKSGNHKLWVTIEWRTFREWLVLLILFRVQIQIIVTNLVVESEFIHQRDVVTARKYQKRRRKERARLIFAKHLHQAER